MQQYIEIAGILDDSVITHKSGSVAAESEAAADQRRFAIDARRAGMDAAIVIMDAKGRVFLAL